MRSVTAEDLARFFHETYESLAPTYGWETQAASRTEWGDVPEANRNLMVATAEEVLNWLDDGGDPFGPTVVQPSGEIDRPEILESEHGGHQYPGWEAFLLEGPAGFFTSECEHGCGATLGRATAHAPAGVDPYGECPEHPDKVSRGLDATITELKEDEHAGH